MRYAPSALQVIPRQLCDNAGFDATDVLNKLRQKHALQSGSLFFLFLFLLFILFIIIIITIIFLCNGSYYHVAAHVVISEYFCKCLFLGSFLSCIMMPFAWLGSFCELCLEKLFRWFWAAVSVVTAIRTLGLELFSIDITLHFGVI